MANVFRVTVTSPSNRLNLDFRTKREREDFLVMMNNLKTNASFSLSEGKREEVNNDK